MCLVGKEGNLSELRIHKRLNRNKMESQAVQSIYHSRENKGQKDVCSPLAVPRLTGIKETHGKWPDPRR